MSILLEMTTFDCEKDASVGFHVPRNPISSFDSIIVHSKICAVELSPSYSKGNNSEFSTALLIAIMTIGFACLLEFVFSMQKGYIIGKLPPGHKFSVTKCASFYEMRALLHNAQLLLTRYKNTCTCI